MPVHHFVTMEHGEVGHCLECGSTWNSDVMREWTEPQLMDYLARCNVPEPDARILIGSWLVARDGMAPASQQLGEWIELTLNTARTAGWRGYALDMKKVASITEGELIAALVKEQPSDQEARILLGVWLEQKEHISPSSEKFEARMAAILGAARKAGWGQVTKETSMALRNERQEQQAKQYAQAHHVPIERGRAAVLAGHDAPPVPVDALSHEVEARAKAYAKQHGVEFSVALEKVFAADPVLADAYVRPPVFPSAYAEQTAEQLVGKMTKAELTELLVTRKVGLTDGVAKHWSYEWLTGPGGMDYGTQAAADAHNAWWEKIQLERFKRFGLSQDTQR